MRVDQKMVIPMTCLGLVMLSLTGCTAAEPEESQSPACAAAWRDLDAVTNASDAEYEEAGYATLDECTTVAQWKSGGTRYPEAAGWTEATDENLDLTIDSWCVTSIRSAVCVDAAEQGILTFDPEDPRLEELQRSS